MRSRYVKKEAYHKVVQTAWTGGSSSTSTDGDYSDFPPANPLWDGLSSLSCRYFDDVIGQDFLSRRSRDELIVNPMQSVGWSLTNPQIYQEAQITHVVPEIGFVDDYSCKNTWSSLTYSGITFYLGPNPPTSHDAAFALVSRVLFVTSHAPKVAQAIIEAENAATVRFRTDYADMVDILLSDRDAFQMLPGLLHQISRLTLDFERRRLSALPSDMSRLWLAYRYGIRPLLYDVSTLLRHLSKKGAVRRSFRSRSVDVFSELSSGVRRYGLGWNAAENADTTQAASLITVRSHIRAGITADLVLDDDSNPGLRWDRLLPTMWDLTPYSFLVDWILNVSDWLSNFAPSPCVRQQVGFVTHSCNISVQGSAYATTNPSSFPIEVEYDSVGFHMKDVATFHTFNDKGYTLLGTFKARDSFEPDVKLHFDPISWISAAHLADLLSIIMDLKSLRTSIRRLSIYH